MKKILSLVLAGLLLIGLAGCSGVLHDVPSPNDMAGNWFYLEVDTSACPTDTINVIFNGPAGTTQTDDITDVPKTGQIYYVWESKGGTASVSERTDQPDKGIGNSTDKLGVYVFSNASAVNFYAWDSGASSTWWADGTAAGTTAANWPGVAMNTDAEIVVETVKASLTFKVTGLTESDYLYINGTPWSWGGDWPFNDWNSGDSEKTAACLKQTERFATADESGVATFGPFVVEVPKNTAATQEIKVVTIEGDEAESYAPGTVNFNDNGKFEIPASAADASYTVAIDVSGGSYNCSIE